MKHKYPNWMLDLLRDEHNCGGEFFNNNFYLTWSINYELYKDADMVVWEKLYPNYYKTK